MKHQRGNTPMLSFQQWVDSEGGQVACAVRYGFPVASLGAWYRLERYPRPSNQSRILLCSGNNVDLQALLQRFVEVHAPAANKTRRRLLKGCSLVNSVARLKQVFAELNIPESRANLHGERITARWSTTNVSVNEIREAVLALAESGKDCGDVQLIHTAIRDARSAALGRLEK
jgi:hypothetical protein